MGGTETWTKTLYDEFTRLGHSVYTFSADGGNYWGGRVHTTADYDLTLVNHNTMLHALSKGGGWGRIVCTVHGVIPSLERPIPGADVYVGVSEETAGYVKEAIGVQARVIRNPIDTSKFKSTRSPNPTLKSVMLMTNNQSPFKRMVRPLLRGYEVHDYGGANRVTDTVHAYNQSDLVIGLGRTALEAMACERNVIVAGWSGVDGFVAPFSAEVFRACNMSGRTMRGPTENVGRLLHLYDPDLGASNREYVIQNNDSKLIAQQYLELV